MKTESLPILIRQLIPDEDVRNKFSAVQMGQKVWKSGGWGRITNDIPQIPKLVNAKLDTSFWTAIYDCAKQYFGEQARPSYWKWARYSPRYGTPNVPPHMDLNACTYTIDLQLSGNTDWEIYVEGVPYQMQNGDALLYGGCDQFHWRPEYPNSDINSYLEMCFIHFVDPGHWYHEKGPGHIDSDEIGIPWRKRMLELLPLYKCDTYQPHENPEEFPGY